MRFLNKTISFLAVFSVLPASYALTARPSIIGTASSRMPTMATNIYGVGSSNTSSATGTASSLLDNIACIDAYTACMKGEDACGPDFSECTTRVLFHGKMPQCISTLAQCSTSGINSLFGVGNTAALSTIKSKDSITGEITDYTYPTDGSVMGQTIIGAAISNRYDTSTCIKRYTSCLHRDNVCGADFELCTTSTEFRKQRVFCDSTLARCQSAGITELFGQSSSTTYTATSRIGELVSQGAATAAVNAVSTCYKVVDSCILNACSSNPYRCSENASTTIADLVSAINDGTLLPANDVLTATDIIGRSGVSGYIKSACLDTIGSNKYCYATFLGNGQMPTNAQLRDEDNHQDIFEEAYAARLQNNVAMKAKIADLVDKFDTTAKQKCSDTIKKCAMRTCGGGSGAACYSKVFGNSVTNKSINNSDTYSEIETGCSAIVNTDMYCQYAARNPNSSGAYSYSYINNSAFTTLFPAYDSNNTTNNDPIGVVAELNAALATNYSDAALADMKKQCQRVATNCVKTMCGSDYEKCYRNRNDVESDLTNTGNTAFDRSMNKMGGVLDYTVVLGMCLETVKNAPSCEEHLAIETVKYQRENASVSTPSWGGATSVSQGWLDAGSATKIDTTYTDDSIQLTNDNGEGLCTNQYGAQGVCDGVTYTNPVMLTYSTYVQTKAASSLFKDLIYDIEKQAQATYKAKLNEEQNACYAMNEGGVRGTRDMGGAYMWAKLRGRKVPKNYSTVGLSDSDIVASNDLYGSFCRIRVTLQSDDKYIQEKLSNASWAYRNFAVGDPFTCGSWIPLDDLEKLANEVIEKKNEISKSSTGWMTATGTKGQSQSRQQAWMTALGAVGFGTGGAFLGDSIGKGNVLGGLTGYSQWNKNGTNNTDLTTCQIKASEAASATDVKDGKAAAQEAINAANKYVMLTNRDNSDVSELNTKITALRSAMNGIETTTNTPSKEAKDSALAALKSAIKRYCKDSNANFDVCKEFVDVDEITEYDVPNLETWLRAEEPKGDEKTVAKNILSSMDSYFGTVGAVTTGTKVMAAGKQNEKFRTAANELANECATVAADVASQQTKNRRNWIIGTSIAGAAVGGVTTYLATRDIQQENLSKEYKEAYEDFMNTLGNHIQCYVGGEPAGKYGQTATITFD